MAKHVTMPCGWNCGQTFGARGLYEHFAKCPNRPESKEALSVDAIKRAIEKLPTAEGSGLTFTPNKLHVTREGIQRATLLQREEFDAKFPPPLPGFSERLDQFMRYCADRIIAENGDAPADSRFAEPIPDSENGAQGLPSKPVAQFVDISNLGEKTELSYIPDDGTPQAGDRWEHRDGGTIYVIARDGNCVTYTRRPPADPMAQQFVCTLAEFAGFAAGKL